jgi:putative tricarboxylic transport membrane protein
VLAFVLAPMLEQSVRQSMVMSGDGAAIFVNRPVTLSLILLSLFLIAVLVRKEVFSNKWRKI